MQTDKSVRYKEKRLYRFDISEPTMEDPTLVVCPKCEQMARIFPSKEQPKTGHSMRMVCTNCAYTKENVDNVRSYYWHGSGPTDGYFGYALWLKSTCCGEALWVFNKRHLEFLEGFVSAQLRQREKDEKYGWANASLLSRLPKWIKSKKNREKILECLEKLRVLSKS